MDFAFLRALVPFDFGKATRILSAVASLVTIKSGGAECSLRTTVVEASNEPAWRACAMHRCTHCCCICLVAPPRTLHRRRRRVVCNLFFRLAIAITDVISQGVSVRMRRTQLLSPPAPPLVLPR